MGCDRHWPLNEVSNWSRSLHSLHHRRALVRDGPDVGNARNERTAGACCARGKSWLALSHRVIATGYQNFHRGRCCRSLKSTWNPSKTHPESCATIIITSTSSRSSSLLRYTGGEIDLDGNGAGRIINSRDFVVPVGCFRSALQQRRDRGVVSGDEAAFDSSRSPVLHSLAL